MAPCGTCAGFVSLLNGPQYGRWALLDDALGGINQPPQIRSRVVGIGIALESVYDSQGALAIEREYVWLDSMPLVMAERVFDAQGAITSSHLVYLHDDQIDAPRIATNSLGTLNWRWDGDAFGVGEANSDPDGDASNVVVNLRFPGQYYDDETGLAYNYTRDYDPAIGRYI